jgi:two-component system alkaline phosphatase synthesis response regulator PhoP
VVDDEQDILEFLGYNLRKEGYEVQTAEDGKTAIEVAKLMRPHLVLLDVMMPGMDGIETCRRFREEPKLKDTVIAFLTARAEDYSQIAGLDAGADDYVTKPVKPRVLLARVAALLRRSGNQEEPANITVGDITLDRERFIVFRGDTSFDFPKKEFELLALLMSKPGKVFLREDILEKVWGGDVVVGDRTIDVHIRKIREKIGENYIRTIKGVGYKFDI